MSGSLGNDNLNKATAGGWLTVDGTADEVTLPVGTQAVYLSCTEDCWVLIGDPGESPTAVKPSGEKIFGRSHKLLADVQDLFYISSNEDASLVQISAIQDSAPGVLTVTCYQEV